MYGIVPTGKGLSHLFDDLFEGFGSFESRGNFGEANVYENDSSYRIEMCLPGAKADDVNVTLDNGVLTVCYEQKNEEDKGRLIHRGMTKRSVKRMWRVSQQDSVSAELKDGVLQITIDKAEEEKALRIPVKVV